MPEVGNSFRTAQSPIISSTLTVLVGWLDVQPNEEQKRSNFLNMFIPLAILDPDVKTLFFLFSD